MSLWFQTLPRELATIIKGFRNIISCHERSVEVDSRHMPVENDYLVFLSHRLYALPYKTPITPFQDVLRISLLVYGLVRIWGWSRKPCFAYMAQMARQKIEKCDDFLQETAPDLLFWALFLGGLVSTGLDGHDWFLARLDQLAERMCILDWDQAVLVLQGFFFVCRSTDESAKELWASMLCFRDNLTARIPRLCGLPIRGQ